MKQERLYKTLLKSVVSEKAETCAELNGQYVFRVVKDAKKGEIKAAVEKMFEVKVEKVTTLIKKGKTRRTRYGLGKCSDWKKAYVRLAEGQEIDFTMGA